MTALGWCIIANFALARHGPSRHDVSVIFTTAAVRRDGGSGAVHNTKVGRRLTCMSASTASAAR